MSPTNREVLNTIKSSSTHSLTDLMFMGFEKEKKRTTKLPWKDIIYLTVIGGIIFLYNQIPYSFTVYGELNSLTRKCAFGEVQGIEKTRWRFDKDMNLRGVDIKCKGDITLYKSNTSNVH